VLPAVSGPEPTALPELFSSVTEAPAKVLIQTLFWMSMTSDVGPRMSPAVKLMLDWMAPVVTVSLTTELSSVSATQTHCR